MRLRRGTFGELCWTRTKGEKKIKREKVFSATGGRGAERSGAFACGGRIHVEERGTFYTH